MNITQETIAKWKPILESADAPAIKDSYRRNVLTQLLENQVTDSQRQAEALAGSSTMLSESAASTQTVANVQNYDPVLISLIRRTMPNLMAYDVCGVQPMTGPTGLIFAYRPKYADGTPNKINDGTEAFYNEADTTYSGTGAQAGTNPAVLNDATPGAYTTGTGMATSDAELLGTDAGDAFKEMGFELEKITVTAQSRALKASYSVETAQDMKAIHGLDAETELANILASEVLADINREVIRTIYGIAKAGAQEVDLTTPGVYDLDADSNGRWSVEKFKGMLFQLERDANRVAQQTRRGKANFIICSSDVASALAMAGKLDYAPALSTDLEVDDTGNTFAGVLNGKFRVYIDPYATGDFYVVGYKGSSAYDAGLYYCPYVPLQMYKAIGEDSFQPRIGFKTRYGLIANPYSEGTVKGAGALTANANVYYRRVKIANLHGATT
jgi:hypothetical protein